MTSGAVYRPPKASNLQKEKTELTEKIAWIKKEHAAALKAEKDHSKSELNNLKLVNGCELGTDPATVSNTGTSLGHDCKPRDNTCKTPLTA